ncbi:hypothetical protein BDV59DRAFT_168205 [Aspergillus ambiguus]|uniref:uncharacterized protein n=1 Tax=Aspergillus ambiguus TaxID=176160 RepID=UPI003CCE05AA
MQVAEILSDLTSLRVCDHHDALALVTVNERIAPSTTDENSTRTEEKPNEDLQRAKELVELHYEIKARHANGTVGDELARAREDVNQVLWDLDM